MNKNQTLITLVNQIFDGIQSGPKIKKHGKSKECQINVVFNPSDWEGQAVGKVSKYSLFDILGIMF